MKYKILHFLSLYGSPVYTNYWLLAVLIAFYKRLRYGLCEIKIINTQTNKHQTVIL